MSWIFALTWIMHVRSRSVHFPSSHTSPHPEMAALFKSEQILHVERPESYN
jgi:hypothetical protein